MPTLIESPSPAASPLSSGYSHLIAPRRSSSQISQYHPSTSPATRPLYTIASSPHYSPRLRPAPQPPVRPVYADAGIQVTPVGSSSAERRDTNLATDAPAGGNKRKETSPSPLMRPTTRAATGTTRSPPAEPKPREDPSQTTGTTEAPPAQEAPRGPATPDNAEHGIKNATAAAKRLRTGETTVKMMPRPYELCNPKDLGVLIANMLLELIRLNDNIPLRDGKLTRFHSRAPPGISCHDYLLRLIQHATLSPPILLSMVFYIDRLCALYPSFTISSLTVHRFLITAATVASKGLSDSFWTNPTYARIGGISTGELATLEMDFLQRVQWRIVPKPEVLRDYYVSLVQRSEGYELEEEDDSSDDTDRMDEGPS